MLELLDKIYEFKDTLDKSDTVININKYHDLINKNSELKSKIKEYNSIPTDKLKMEIYDYMEIKEYKKYENELNLIILEINSELKKISNTRSCYK